MERYNRIIGIDGQLVQVNCPIIFEKGALLKDNKNEENVLQLQFKNVSMDIINAVYITVQCYDIENHLLGEASHKYLDLSAKYNDKFGDREIVSVQWDEARKFIFEIQKVIFAGAPAYVSDDKMYKIQWDLPLDELEDLKAEYKYEVKQINASTTCKVRPAISSGLWQCTCGSLNLYSNEKCGSCGINKQKLFDCWNLDKLAVNKKASEEEAEKQRLIEQTKRKEMKKKLVTQTSHTNKMCLTLKIQYFSQ